MGQGGDKDLTSFSIKMACQGRDVGPAFIRRPNGTERFEQFRINENRGAALRDWENFSGRTDVNEKASLYSLFIE